MTSISAVGSAPHVSATLASTMSNAAYPLRATIERSGSMVLLRVGGEVDAHNVATFATLLSQAASATTAPGPLLVDINGLDFVACCGFAALTEQSAECQRRGISLCLVSSRPSTARIMAAGRFDAEMSLYQDVQAALESDRRVGQRRPLGTADTAMVS
ncbi:anti-sigma factor antagonist [Mycolicibacterium hodleri]|nr:anti-sigma factor antagonist [Mycolicibacterium hodleri]